MNRLRAGVTLIEMLVVLIILGILGAVTVRAMDSTRERANYDKTMKTMERLAHAILGNPNLISEGRRTDFGFVGDMGRFPDSLGELIRRPGNNPAWNGPYVRIPFQGDELSYKSDGWGRELQYMPAEAQLLSLGNGTFPITYRLAAETASLFRNQVSGTIVDSDGNPPGALQAGNIWVRLWTPNPATGELIRYDTNPNPDGTFLFDSTRYRIPVGNHLLRVVKTSGTPESLTKWIQVLPRVGAVVDFRLSTPFGGRLKLVGGTVSAFGNPVANNVVFQVYNTGHDTIRLDTIRFGAMVIAPPAYCETLKLRSAVRWDWQLVGHRAGANDTLAFTIPDFVPGGELLQVEFNNFRDSRTGAGLPVNMHGAAFTVRFDDGSTVDINVP